MHGRAPSEYLRGKERQRGILAAIRQHLKKANYHNFNDLLHAFRHYDKVLRNQLFSYVGEGVGCDFFLNIIYFSTQIELIA
jgi:CTP-dependent riboflavin kinase